MSEATLTKIKNDCAKMEAELLVYKNSQPIAAACEALISYIVAQPEPFINRGDANPWVTSGGGEGGCSIS